MSKFSVTFELDTDFETEAEFKEWLETLLDRVAHTNNKRIVSVAEMKEVTLEFTHKQWKVIREILDDTNTHADSADELFKAVFAKHARYDSDTANNFLCPLLDRLKKMGGAPIDIVVED